ncbi:uncharacterized protein [Primulina eburnea]|uniref:uncharacterized protein isoform X1 n=1 Tax=Primulina eburnea TaxID=1245227 RepID=UPI003C6C42C6
MAASSPAKSVSADVAVAMLTPLSSNSSKNLRGLNKPRCIKCGNVARSRCPYQSCKSCCAKAQNPCHIHVLKGNSSFPDKVPSSSSALLDQQSTEVSHSGRLRQLSSNFVQFSNLNAPFRSRKPLTRKDAQVINEWRFLKLKEYKDRGIETENEVFDRYTQNMCLLGEVFSVNSMYDDQFQEELRSEVSSSSEENIGRTVNDLKSKLRSNPMRTANFRKNIHYIVDQGLNKLGKPELNEDSGDHDLEISKDINSCEVDHLPASIDLIEKMNQVRNEEDLKACWETASQMFIWSNKTGLIESGDFPILVEQDEKSDSSQDRHPLYSLPKWVNPVNVDQESLRQIDAQFSALENIENL